MILCETSRAQITSDVSFPVDMDFQMQNRLRFILLFTSLLTLFILGMALIQFSTPDMPDNDGRD